MSVLKLLRMYMSVLKFQYNSWKLQILNYSKKTKKKNKTKTFWGHLCFAGTLSLALVHPCRHLALTLVH